MKGLMKNKEIITQFICLILIAIIMGCTSVYIKKNENKNDAFVAGVMQQRKTDVDNRIKNNQSLLESFKLTNNRIEVTGSKPVVASDVLRNSHNDNDIQEKTQDEKYYSVVADALNVRETSTTDGKIVGLYYKNDVVEIKGKEGDWYKTEDGYIKAGYLSTTKKPNKVARASRGGSIYISRGELNFSLDVVHSSNVTVQQLQKLTKGTGLQGTEEAMIDVEIKYGINTFFTLAVARLESGNGNSSLARGKNNIFSLNAIDSDPYGHAYSYSSKSACVYSFADIVKKNYINRGLDTINKISPIYCTTDSWATQVSTIMKEEYRTIKR